MNNAHLKNPSSLFKVGIRNSLRTRILVSFVSLFVVFLVGSEIILLYGLPYTKHVGWIDSHRNQVIKQLDLIADLKKQQLHSHLQELALDTELLVINPFLQKAIPQIKAMVLQKQETYLDKRQLLNSLQADSLYQDVNGLITNTLHSKAIYENFIVADINDGHVFMASNPDDFGFNISQENIFIRTLEKGALYFNDINEDRITHLPVFQIGHVIKSRSGIPVAIVIFDVHIQKLFLPFLHTGSGLGQTGETLLVNEQSRILTSLKYPLKTGERPQLLQYQIKAKPATLAAQGFEGVISS